MIKLRINRIRREGSLIDDLLKHYKVKDLDAFKNGITGEVSNLVKKKVSGVFDAIGYILAAANAGLKFGLLVDDDADGFTSSAILYSYLKDLYQDEIDIQLFFHEHKTHGLTEQIMSEMQSAQLDIILIPDAGVNDVLQHNQLVFCGAKVIVIDHHIIEPLPVDEEGNEIPTSAIIVSNQNPNNPEEINHGLTGAGMVLRFCEAIDEATGNNFAEKYYDLASIGQIGDASNISDEEIRSIVHRGLSNINNHFLKQAIGDHAEKEIAPPIGMSFSVIPMINAVTRVGTKEEKRKLFEALVDKSEPQIVVEKRRRKNKETGKFEMRDVEFTTTELLVSEFMKIKDRQAKIVKEAVESCTYINSSGSVAIVEIDNFSDKIGGVTGLIANKLVTKLQMPALVLVDRGEEMIGSGRGYEKKIKDLRQWCINTEEIEWAKGHDNAFGISIHKDKFSNFVEKSKVVTESSGVEKVYDVIEVQHANIDHRPLYEAIENEHLYGGTVESPKFLFENITVNKSDITVMAGGTCISFYAKGVTFIAFGLPVGSTDSFDQGFKSSFQMNFVGTPGLNMWRGRQVLQVVIEEYEFYEPKEQEEIDEDSFIF